MSTISPAARASAGVHRVPVQLPSLLLLLIIGGLFGCGASASNDVVSSRATSSNTSTAVAPTVTVTPTPAPTGPSATPVATPKYDPQHAAIIFLPGLEASDLGTAPPSVTDPSQATFIWPGVADNFLANFTLNFTALGMINTLDSSGNVVHHTTSSAGYPVGCGSMPFGNGTVAVNEPVPIQPTWFVPEKRGNQIGPYPTDPFIPAGIAQDNYNAFGALLQKTVAQDGRGQQIVFYAWDWRRPPAEQVAAFHQKVLQLTQSGYKVTVVAHSFGNFFFREWVNFVESQGQQAGTYCGRFLSVAGGWWGVTTAWEHPAFGIIQPTVASDVLTALIGPDNVRQAFASFSGIYTIFPSAAFDSFISNGLGRTGEHWLAIPTSSGIGSQWVPYADIPLAVQLQMNVGPQSNIFPPLSKVMYEYAVAGMSGVGFNTSGIHDWVGVVGSGLKTSFEICSGADIWPDGTTDGDLITSVGGATVLKHRLRYISGDKNVPVFSAIQGSDPAHPPGDPVQFFFTVGISHIDLMNNAAVIAQTVPYVCGDAPLTYTGPFQRTPSDATQ